MIYASLADSTSAEGLRKLDEALSPKPPPPDRLADQRARRIAASQAAGADVEIG